MSERTIEAVEKENARLREELAEALARLERIEQVVAERAVLLEAEGIIWGVEREVDRP